MWFILIGSWLRLQRLLFFLQEEPYWLVPNRSISLDRSCRIEGNVYPFGQPFLVYIQGSWTLGKPYGIKPRCYWEHLGERIWDPDGNMLRTHWEQGKNTQKIPLSRPPHTTPKRKKRVHHECILSLPIDCTEFLFPKQVVTIFWLGLMAGAEIWGHSYESN